MSRRLIISILAVLIVGVVGGTVYLIISRLRSNQSDETTQTPSVGLPDSSGRQPVTDPTGDPDGDGLNNADERLWGTNPNNPDTDGDGFNDGDEVTANHNPTIPGPNDLLPAGFEPGKEIVPLDEAPREAIAIDQFFADNLDLSGPKENLTEKYQREFPEDQRSPDTLQTFVTAEPIITQLPTPVDRAIRLSTDTPLVMAEYLDEAGKLSRLSSRWNLPGALNDLYGSGDPGAIQAIALRVRSHQQHLLELPVPPSAQNLHRLLLGYTELLAATYDQMARHNEDPVTSVLAMRQLEEIDARYFPLIEQEIARLNALLETL